MQKETQLIFFTTLVFALLWGLGVFLQIDRLKAMSFITAICLGIGFTKWIMDIFDARRTAKLEESIAGVKALLKEDQDKILK